MATVNRYEIRNCFPGKSLLSSYNPAINTRHNIRNNSWEPAARNVVGNLGSLPGSVRSDDASLIPTCLNKVGDIGNRCSSTMGYRREQEDLVVSTAGIVVGLSNSVLSNNEEAQACDLRFAVVEVASRA